MEEHTEENKGVKTEESGNHVAVVEENEKPTVMAENPSASVFGMSALEVRTGLIKALLGCLVAAAVVAVVAILIGSMTDVVWRSIGTVFVAMLHIFLVFSVLSITTNEKNPALTRSTNFLVNTTVAIVILSFFTAILHIWDVMPSDIAGKLYITYMVLFAVLLHVKVLLDVEATYQKVHPYVLANTFVMSLVAALILGVVYTGSIGFELLNGFYGRLLAASAIVDVTLSMIIAVLQRLNIQRHPEMYKDVHVAQYSAMRIFVMLLLFLVLGWPILSFIFAVFYR